MVPKTERASGMDWEFGVSRCELLHLGCIYEVLLYSTGNYIQSPGIDHDEKCYKIIHIYTHIHAHIYIQMADMYIWLSHCCIAAAMQIIHTLIIF